MSDGPKKVVAAPNVYLKDGGVLQRDGQHWALLRNGEHIRYLNEFESEFIRAALAMKPSDAELERSTGEPHIDGWPLVSGLPASPTAPAEPSHSEHLYLLHTGQIDSNGEQDDPETEVDSYKALEKFCRTNPGRTVKLYPAPQRAAGVAAAPQAEPLTDDQIDQIGHNWGSPIKALSWDVAGKAIEGREFTLHRFRCAIRDAIKRYAQRPIQAEPQPTERESRSTSHTYASTQATTCAGCLNHKHTPLRIDAMGGHVCLTCIDQKLGSLLGEFGYPEPEPPTRDSQEEPFEEWWAKEGQFLRAGGGQYEKTFSWHAWLASRGIGTAPKGDAS